MKKIYESPKSLTVIIQLGGLLLDGSPVTPGNPGDEPAAREHKGSWEDGENDEEW